MRAPFRLLDPLSLLLLLLALATVGCSKPTAPEDAIREVIDAIETAAESGDIGGIMDHLAEDYSDSDSNDKGSLRGILFMQLQRSGRVSVTKRIDSIMIAEAADTARALVFAGLSDGPIRAGPTSAEVWRFDIQFRLEGQAWLMTRVDQSRSTLMQLAGGD